jgi:hypothetical protein
MEAAENVGPRVPEWVARRAEGIPALAWPFIALAVLQLALRAYKHWSYLSFDLLGIDAASVIWALLPAAVLIGCPDAWRSARLVLVGAVVWTTIGATAGIVDFVQSTLGLGWSASSDFSGASIWSNMLSVAEIVALLGPALVVLGLRTRRRTRTTWPSVPVFVFLALLILACLNAGSGQANSIEASSGAPVPVPYSLGDWLSVALASLRPMETLFVGALAWSSLSAVRAGEKPVRFWLALLGAAVLLLGLHVYDLVPSLAAAGGPISPETWANFSSALVPLAVLADLGGAFLLVVAFGGGLANDPLDLGPVVGG